MDEFFEKYGRLIIAMLCGAVSLVIVMFVVFPKDDGSPSDASILMRLDRNEQAVNAEYEIPEAEFSVINGIIENGDSFDWKDYVTCHLKDDPSTDLYDYITVDGSVDTKHSGKYVLTFRLDYKGKSMVQYGEYYVKGALTE